MTSSRTRCGNSSAGVTWTVTSSPSSVAAPVTCVWRHERFSSWLMHITPGVAVLAPPTCSLWYTRARNFIILCMGIGEITCMAIFTPPGQRKKQRNKEIDRKQYPVPDSIGAGPAPDARPDGVLFSIDFFVSLFLSLSATLRENGWTDLHEIFREGVEWPWDDLITFLVNSEKPRARCRYAQRGDGVCCALAPQLVYKFVGQEPSQEFASDGDKTRGEVPPAGSRGRGRIKPVTAVRVWGEARSSQQLMTVQINVLTKKKLIFSAWGFPGDMSLLSPSLRPWKHFSHFTDARLCLKNFYQAWERSP